MLRTTQKLKRAAVGLVGLGLAACTTAPTPAPVVPTEPVTVSPYQVQIDAEATLRLAETLSSDEFGGRATGTEGSAKAQKLIAARMGEIGLTAFNPGYRHEFLYFGRPDFGFISGQDPEPGTNLIGLAPGTGNSDFVIVISAHYDHLGTRGNKIYNGADDNASGVAGMLALANYFVKNPPLHDMIFVAFDAEEDGFGGSLSFIDFPPVPKELIAFNLNLDMISRGDTGTLWAAGTSHSPHLLPMMESVAAIAPIDLQMGFDSGDGRDDWTMLSDQMAFHRNGIAFIYLGVEDHVDYHRPSDTFEKVNTDWYLGAIETARLTAAAVDGRLAAANGVIG